MEVTCLVAKAGEILLMEQNTTLDLIDEKADEGRATSYKLAVSSLANNESEQIGWARQRARSKANPRCHSSFHLIYIWKRSWFYFVHNRASKLTGVYSFNLYLIPFKGVREQLHSIEIRNTTTNNAPSNDQHWCWCYQRSILLYNILAKLGAGKLFK